MVDPVQRTSSLPLPEYQTGKGTQNPLPTDSPAELKRVDNAVKDADTQEQRDNFEDYLNQTSITTLEKNQDNGRFDPVTAVTSSSVYTQPNDKTQFP